VKALGYLSQKFAFQTGISPFHEFDYTLVECTTNSHCKENVGADPNKGKCNIKSDGTAITANFSQNTCVRDIDTDIVPPTITINSITRIDPDPGTPGQWLKAGTYRISVSDTDLGGSQIDITKCTYQVKDTNIPVLDSGIINRTCGSTFDIKIGDSIPGAQCKSNGFEACRLDIDAVDKAGNPAATVTRFLNVDTIPPTAN
jgi:hypothetical protein